MDHETQSRFSWHRALIFACIASLLAGDVPFARVAIDDSIKDPWAKIIADIDKDGFADIVIGGQAGPLVWYKYPNWTKAVIAEGGYRTVDGEAGDVDGDGDLDIVMGGLIWYENPLPAARIRPGNHGLLIRWPTIARTTSSWPIWTRTAGSTSSRGTSRTSAPKPAIRCTCGDRKRATNGRTGSSSARTARGSPSAISTATAIRTWSSAASGSRTTDASLTAHGRPTSSATGIPAPASKWPTSMATAGRTSCWRRRNSRATGIGSRGSRPRRTPGRATGPSTSLWRRSSASSTAWRPPISTATEPWTSRPLRCIRATIPDEVVIFDQPQQRSRVGQAGPLDPGLALHSGRRHRRRRRYRPHGRQLERPVPAGGIVGEQSQIVRSRMEQGPPASCPAANKTHSVRALRAFGTVSCGLTL